MKEQLSHTQKCPRAKLSSHECCKCLICSKELLSGSSDLQPDGALCSLHLELLVLLTCSTPVIPGEAELHCQGLDFALQESNEAFSVYLWRKWNRNPNPTAVCARREFLSSRAEQGISSCAMKKTMSQDCSVYLSRTT